jgi:hypothetical protein
VDLETKLAACLLRVATKDAEFDKERQAWRQKERQYLQTIKDLKCSAITKTKP